MNEQTYSSVAAQGGPAIKKSSTTTAKWKSWQNLKPL